MNGFAKYWFAAIVLLVVVFTSCSKKQDLALIAVIKGNPVYIDELELLGRLATPKAGLDFDSEAGQRHYRQIAPNLYNTLIDIYVMKYAAEDEGFQSSPDEVETEFQTLKDALTQQGQYEKFTKSLGLTEKRFRETIGDQLAMEAFQLQKMNEAKYEPSEKEIEEYYYQNHAQFRYPRRIRVSHIFVLANPDAGDDAMAKAKQKTEQLRKMIGNEPSKTFSGLARQYSEEQGTASRGGDLGFIDRDHPHLFDFFRQAAFSLKEGEISDAIAAPNGYHIIWCTDHEESLEEAREEIKKMLINQAMNTHFNEWLEQAREKYNIERLFDPVKFEVLETRAEES
ncbi:MAG: hypothetical protein C4527_07150 [Candidatus Omnitrophota bacterium]|jgi:parvulin-like peptidyl-prolyl isomerase|nr:MAG: hypothetical protein C4527_07150 [Candidatus Omnitrophota bacterium]